MDPFIAAPAFLGQKYLNLYGLVFYCGSNYHALIQSSLSANSLMTRSVRDH